MMRSARAGPLLGVAHHDDRPRLRHPAGGRQQAQPHELVHVRVGHRTVGVAAHAAPPADGLDRVHHVPLSVRPVTCGGLYPGPAGRQSSGRGGRRATLVWARRVLSARRRSRAARPGRVGRRAGDPGASASATRRSRRSITTSRLRSRERSAWLVSRSGRSSRPRASRQARGDAARGGRRGRRARTVSSARVSVVVAPLPAGARRARVAPGARARRGARPPPPGSSRGRGHLGRVAGRRRRGPPRAAPWPPRGSPRGPSRASR